MWGVDVGGRWRRDERARQCVFRGLAAVHVDLIAQPTAFRVERATVAVHKPAGDELQL